MKSATKFNGGQHGNMYSTRNHGWPLNGHSVYHASFYGVNEMNEELYREMQRRMVQICDAFSALEFAYRNVDSSTSSTDLASIIGVATQAGMAAFENLSAAIDKASAK